MINMFYYMRHYQRISKLDEVFHIPTNTVSELQYCSTPFQHSHQQLVLSDFLKFDFNYSNWYVVILHCGFILKFSENQQYWEFLHVIICYLYIFFVDLSIQIFCPLFNWDVYIPVIELESYFYILDIIT